MAFETDLKSRKYFNRYQYAIDTDMIQAKIPVYMHTTAQTYNIYSVSVNVYQKRIANVVYLF